MHTQECTCDRCDKARACQVTLHRPGQSPVYNVTSPTSRKIYKVVANSNEVIRCNCENGWRTKQRPCSHAQRINWEVQLEKA